jgi:hypothetical protein
VLLRHFQCPDVGLPIKAAAPSEVRSQDNNIVLGSEIGNTDVKEELGTYHVRSENGITDVKENLRSSIPRDPENVRTLRVKQHWGGILRGQTLFSEKRRFYLQYEISQSFFGINGKDPPSKRIASFVGGELHSPLTFSSGAHFLFPFKKVQQHEAFILSCRDLVRFLCSPWYVPNEIASVERRGGTGGC